MGKQLTLSVLSDGLCRVRTKKKDLFAQIGSIVSWGKWITILKPRYCKGEHGNKSVESEMMLRIQLLKNLYNLSDMAMVGEVIDNRASSDFCGPGCAV